MAICTLRRQGGRLSMVVLLWATSAFADTRDIHMISLWWMHNQQETIRTKSLAKFSTEGGFRGISWTRLASKIVISSVMKYTGNGGKKPKTPPSRLGIWASNCMFRAGIQLIIWCLSAILSLMSSTAKETLQPKWKNAMLVCELASLLNYLTRSHPWNASRRRKWMNTWFTWGTSLKQKRFNSSTIIEVPIHREGRKVNVYGKAPASEKRHLLIYFPSLISWDFVLIVWTQHVTFWMSSV